MAKKEIEGAVEGLLGEQEPPEQPGFDQTDMGAEVEEVIVPNLWSVTHEAFATDRLDYTETLIVAGSREEAEAKFNTARQQRLEYPYKWGPMTSVEPVRALP